MADTPYISIPPTGTFTAPIIINGTGLTTSVPLLILNGKNLSGIEVQQTGTAPTGFVLRDAAGVMQGALGLNSGVAAPNDWNTPTTVTAGDITLRAYSSQVIRINSGTGGALSEFQASSGTGTKMLYGAVSLTMAASSVFVGAVSATGNFSVNGLTTIDNAGGLTMTATALATGAVAGFPILRTMAGTPTGAVADGAFVIDTTASKLWARVGGAWKGIVIA